MDFGIAFLVLSADTPAAPRSGMRACRLDPHVRKQVNRDILRLEENPRPHGVEKMETREKLDRVYVGPGKNYRVIYQVRTRSSSSW